MSPPDNMNRDLYKAEQHIQRAISLLGFGIADTHRLPRLAHRKACVTNENCIKSVHGLCEEDGISIDSEECVKRIEDQCCGDDNDDDDFEAGKEKDRTYTGDGESGKYHPSDLYTGFYPPKAPDNITHITPSDSCITQSARRGKKAMEYQSSLAARIMSTRGLLVVAPMGSGKTLLAVLCSACALLNIAEVTKVVFLCPAALQQNFRQEVDKYYGHDGGAGKFTIMSYELLVRRFGKLLKNGHRGELFEKGSEFRKMFEGSALICDEVHNLSTTITTDQKQIIENGKKAFLCIKAASYAERALGITGTVCQNEPFEISNLLCFVRSEGRWLKKTQFKDMMANAADRKKFCKGILYFHHLDTRDTFPKLGKPRFVNIPMDDKSYGVYMNIEARSKDMLERYFPGEVMRDPGAFEHALRRAQNVIGDLKIQELLALMKKLFKKGKKRTIIASQFRKYGVDLIVNALRTDDYFGRNASVGYVIGTGSAKDEEGVKQSSTQRLQAIQRFAHDADPDTRHDILVISPAGTEGLDFKQVRNVILFDQCWNMATERQIIGRARRYRSHVDLPPDQQRVDVYHLMLTHTSRETLEQYYRARAIEKDNIIEEELRMLESDIGVPLAKQKQAPLGQPSYMNAPLDEAMKADNARKG